MFEGGGGGSGRRGGRHTTNSAGPGILIALLLLICFGALSLLPPRQEQETTTAAEGGKHRFLRAALPSISSSASSSSTPPSPWHHKTLWPLDGRDFATLFLATCGLVIAAGGGIGGGGILVPLFMLVLEFSPRRAIPLANVTILGGSIANTWYSLSQRHPQADRPLLDWNLILMMEPTTIIGAVAGSFLNKILPELVISILLVIVLALLADRTLRKGIKMFQKEGGMANLWTVAGGEGAAWLKEAKPLSSTTTAEQAAAPAGGRARGKEGQQATTSVPSWIGTIEDQEVLGVSAYGATLSTPPPSVATSRTPSPSKTKKKIFLTPVMMLQGEQEEGREDGGEGGMWSSPFEDLSSSSAAASPSPTKGGNKVLLTPITPERERKQQQQQQQQQQEEELKEEWVSKRTENKHALLPFSSELDSMIEAERHIPLWKPLALTICFLGVIVTDVLKGGEGSPSPLGVTCGSLAYWLVTLAALPWVGTFFYKVRQYILEDYEAKRQSGYIFLTGDVRWTPTNTMQFPLLCATAGLVAGVFGVGGGIVKGPLMLEMGVLPAVAAASAATMILYTSAAASAAFYVFGLIPLDYGALFFAWGFLCTFAGQLVVSHMLRKYKKESFIVLSIGGVILMTVFLMGAEAGENFVRDPAKAVRMSSLCV